MVSLSFRKYCENENDFIQTERILLNDVYGLQTVSLMSLKLMVTPIDNISSTSEITTKICDAKVRLTPSFGGLTVVPLLEIFGAAVDSTDDSVIHTTVTSVAFSPKSI